MPESRKRDQKAAYTPPKGKTDKTPVKLDSPRWLVVAMVACFVFGLLWIVVWYIAPSNPVMGPLAGWNVAIGFVFIAIGFVLSTRWR